jgi:hypothetical protein
MQLHERFWPRVDRSGDCWEWRGGRIPQGYGAVWINGQNHPAHRVAWELTVGPIPPGLMVLHRCDNPPCVNPAHLWLGTQADNMADKVRKGRAAVGAKNGAHTQPNHRSSGHRPGLGVLTWDEIREIRALAATGTRRADLVERYRVSQSHLSRILNNLVWKETSGVG